MSIEQVQTTDFEGFDMHTDKPPVVCTLVLFAVRRTVPVHFIFTYFFIYTHHAVTDVTYIHDVNELTSVRHFVRQLIGTEWCSVWYYGLLLNFVISFMCQYILGFRRTSAAILYATFAITWVCAITAHFVLLLVPHVTYTNFYEPVIFRYLSL